MPPHPCPLPRGRGRILSSLASNSPFGEVRKLGPRFTKRKVGWFACPVVSWSGSPGPRWSRSRADEYAAAQARSREESVAGRRILQERSLIVVGPCRIRNLHAAGKQTVGPHN